MSDDHKHGQLKKVAEIIIPRWWVCTMNGGGYFAIHGKRPEGQLRGENHTIAADSYHVIYGPCLYNEAMQYLDDLESE